MRVPRPSASWCWLIVGLLPACGSDTTVSSYVNPTFVAVDPVEFTQRVACAEPEADAAAASLQSYAAVLLKLVPKAGKVTYKPVATSPITSCRAGVRFQVPATTNAIYEEFYAAELIGFADPVEEVQAVSGNAAAAAAALRGQAQWIGSCGQGRIDSAAPGDAGRVEYPLKGGNIDADGGTIDALYGPKRAFPGRTVTLRGCGLDELSE
jgi:hypothetical protein